MSDYVYSFVSECVLPEGCVCESSGPVVGVCEGSGDPGDLCDPSDPGDPSGWEELLTSGLLHNTTYTKGHRGYAKGQCHTHHHSQSVTLRS